MLARVRVLDRWLRRPHGLKTRATTGGAPCHRGVSRVSPVPAVCAPCYLTPFLMPPPRPSPAHQERLYAAIAEALFKSVPEDWDDILLRIDATETGELRMEISGPANVPNLRAPDDSLYEPAFQLYDLFAGEGRPFSRCDFRLKWNEARASWRRVAEYTYPRGP